MEYITGILALAFCAVFLAGSLSRARVLAARSRLDLVFAGLDAAAALFVARLMMPWAEVPPWLWLILVVLFAAGVVGAVLRGGTLPVVRADRSRGRTISWAGVHAVVLGAVVVLIAG